MRLPSAFTTSITATPAGGAAPLLVTFELHTSNGIAGTVNWSFGDGTYLNASGEGALTPEHTYAVPGSYTVRAEAWEGDVASNGTTTVEVTPSQVEVAVVASPLTGPAPLRVVFTATVSGGSGGYRPVNWSFGDGAFATGANVSHRFTAAGLYLVRATSSDSSGSVGNGSLYVDVVPNASSASPIAPQEWLGIGIAIGLAGLVIAVLLFLRRGRRPAPTPPAGIYGGFEDVAMAPTAPSEITDEAPGRSGVVPGVAPPMSPGISESPGPTEAGAPPTPAGPPGAVPVDRRPDPRQVTREVVDFLYQLGRVAPDDIPTTEWTQRGMGERLSIPQNVLSKVLRRLEAAGIVTTRVEHVHGRPRRVKTYYLTPAGERLARSRRRGPPSTAPGGSAR